MDLIKKSCGDNNSEEYLSKSRQSELSEFDRIIGHIEDILIDEEFALLQKDFLEKYWIEFENEEENKHTYMTIFEKYTTLIETYLEERLKVKMPEFCMKTFSRSLIERKNELEGEVFEMLLTFSDFLSFKEMILDYRALLYTDLREISKSVVYTQEGLETTERRFLPVVDGKTVKEGVAVDFSQDLQITPLLSP